MIDLARILDSLKNNPDKWKTMSHNGLYYKLEETAPESILIFLLDTPELVIRLGTKDDRKINLLDTPIGRQIIDFAKNVLNYHYKAPTDEECNRIINKLLPLGPPKLVS